MQFQNGIIHWNVLFICHVHDCEVDVVSDSLRSCTPKMLGMEVRI
jgi:hypothetical protein